MLDTSATTLLSQFAFKLSPDEVDALKYKLSLAAVDAMQGGFEIPDDLERRASFFSFLKAINLIQPFSDKVPPYGVAYRGRPDFITDEVLNELQLEAKSFRSQAVRNFGQYLYQIGVGNSDAVADRLARSAELLAFVRRYAGPCIPSFISSYIYYDAKGDCSKPHVDNAYTTITVMIGLRHICEGQPASFSVSYWPEMPRLEYDLKEGEMSIFFGTSALHGRTPVENGEMVHSLLMSFKPTDLASYE